MTIETSLRALVAAGADMDVQDVFVEPYLGEQPPDLFAVVDLPRVRATSKNAAITTYDAAGNEVTRVQWVGTGAVKWQGPGAGAAARRFVLFGFSSACRELESRLGVVVENLAEVATGEEVRGDAVVNQAVVGLTIKFDETLTLPVGFVESVTIDTLDHEETRVTREVVDVDAGTPEPV